MALIGYARVSILEEETWRQHDALEAAGCARIFTDRASGAHEERPELARCFEYLREDDTLVVWRLDRLGRSLRDLVDTITALGERSIGLRSLDGESLDTTGAAGPVVLEVCAALAEFELELVRERTALAAAGIREPRLGALVEAARSRPPWRSSSSSSSSPPAPPPARARAPAPAPAPASAPAPAPSDLPSTEEIEAAQDDDLPAASASPEPDSPEPDTGELDSSEPGDPEPGGPEPDSSEPDSPEPIAPPAEADPPAALARSRRRSERRRAIASPALPDPPAAPARSLRPAARRRALITAQIGVSVAAAVVAFHVARSGASTPGVVLANTTANRDAELRYPDGWRRTSADFAVTALGLDDAIVLAQGRTGNSMLMAGLSPATGPTLLPAALLSRLDRLPEPATVRLRGRDAEHYADLSVRGLARNMTVFVVPTTKGALTLACVAKPPDVASVRDVCDRVAQSMLPTRGRALPLGPSPRYQERLNALITTLDATRVGRRTRLASARSAIEQAALSEELSSAYADAYATGSAERVSPREAAAHRRILDAIDETRAAYQRLGNAARGASVPHFDRARTAVAEAERRLRAALAALSALGYEPATGRSSGGS